MASKLTMPIQSWIDFIVARRRMLTLLAFVVLFLASLSRYWVHYDPSGFVRHDPEPMRLAYNLYDTGNFANPFVPLDTGPTAQLTPFYPVFLAMLMKIFGTKSIGLYAIELSAALMLSLQLALYPIFSRILGMGEVTGIIGAAIWIAAKPGHNFVFDNLYIAFLVAIVCCMYRLYLDQGAHRHKKFAWPLGILVGFLVLASPTVAPIYATWLAWEVWQRKMAFFKESFVALVLLPALILAPWMIRNYLVIHSFPVIRDDFGLELSASNNDCAKFSIELNFENLCYIQNHPNDSLDEARKVKELGEAKYNRMRLHEGLTWISSHPSQFMKLSTIRFIAFWMPTDTFTIHYASGRRRERVAIYLLTLLSIPGLIILFRRDIKSALILLSCLTVFPPVYYFVYFDYRYRYPIMWVTFLLGAVPIAMYARRAWDRWAPLQVHTSASK